MSDERILLVDDDEKLIKGLVRHLDDEFDITAALGPGQALELLETDGPFAVVVSDMRMPEMNGVELLRRVRETSPDTVRIMLTGFAELNTTIAAINEGHIFRFLAKPCRNEDMAAALRAGLQQYALVTAERELVEGTLHGSVQVLADILSLVNPLAFGQSTRVRTIVDGVLKRMTISDQWELEIASMLSSLGCVTLPAALLEKKFSGQELTAEEHSLFNRHPERAGSLIRHIPRLERVADIIARQSGDCRPADSRDTERKAQILRLALEFDSAEQRTGSPVLALNELREQSASFETDIFEALIRFVEEERQTEAEEIDVDDLEEGMVLAEDVHGRNGMLLLSKGQRISQSAKRVIENHVRQGAMTGRVKIVAAAKQPLAAAAP